MGLDIRPTAFGAVWSLLFTCSLLVELSEGKICVVQFSLPFFLFVSAATGVYLVNWSCKPEVCEVVADWTLTGGRS